MRPLDILARAIRLTEILPDRVTLRHRDHDVYKCTVEWYRSTCECCREPLYALTRTRARSLVRALESLGLEARIGTEDPAGIEIVFAEVLPADVLETCERVEGAVA